jgi:hypothetical protein
MILLFPTSLSSLGCAAPSNPMPVLTPPPVSTDTSQMYLSFLMLHVCFYTIYLVFRYTSWHFYAFSGTNLLTRCHSASSLFSAIFVF